MKPCPVCDSRLNHTYDTGCILKKEKKMEVKDTVIVINSASGYLDHRITRLPDGTATVEKKENLYLVNGEPDSYKWENLGTFPSPRDAVLHVIEQAAGW
jgi:hypothetical protein